MSTMALAEIYVWGDPDGTTHFSDAPPPPGVPHARRHMPKADRSLFQKARELAIMWYHASPYGGRCDFADMQRIERLYQDLRNEAQYEMKWCLEGWTNSCGRLGIPMHMAILNSAQQLQTYLPPADIRYMKESGYQAQDRSWKCR
jgi:hypothetical protein